MQLPGKIGLQSIAGIMEHLPALTALGSSTVNSYRRLWDQGFWAPVYADWGYQNRTCGLRVSAPGRFEYRSVDSMHNPYLLGAALLKACDHGISNKMKPADPESRNIYEAQKAGKCFIIPAIDCRPIFPGICISLVSGIKVFFPPPT